MLTSPEEKKHFALFVGEKTNKSKWWGPPFSGNVFVWAISFSFLYLVGKRGIPVLCTIKYHTLSPISMGPPTHANSNKGGG